MKPGIIIILLALATTVLMTSGVAWPNPGPATPVTPPSGETAPVNTGANPAGRLERDALTGDWGGGRTWLKNHGLTFKPRLTQFYQGMTAGAGDRNFEYGGKADLLLNADLGRLGFWPGFSLTIHGEYNFGQSVNGRGGTIAPINTALYFPGIIGSDRSDLSSVYLGQRFGEDLSLLFGKMNMIDIAASKPFMGGAGIDSFWNAVFVAPPSGTVPPYLLGALLNWRIDPATFGLWVYDPNDMTNKSGLEDPFVDGITFRVSIDFPVTLAGRGGHQGLVALYSTKDGTDLERDSTDTLIPPFPQGTPGIKNSRYYFAYLFDQYLYQSKADPKEGFGLFGQFGVSDGNPNRLHWLAFTGVGGTGLIPGRSRDNWGIGYYYAAPSYDLKDSLASVLTIRDEQGVEIFYNFTLTPWFTLGVDLQIIQPSLAKDQAVFFGLRNVIRF